MPTLKSNKIGAFYDPDKDINIAPGSTYSGEFYINDPDFTLVSRDPYWEPIVKSEILSGTAGTTAQVTGLAESEYITFVPEDQVRIYFNSLTVTPLVTQRFCTVHTWNRVDLVVIEFINDGSCEIHGTKTTTRFV